jgi:hypothetical protein
VTTSDPTHGIRLADTEEARYSVSQLLGKMYAWRGYTGTHRVEEHPHRVTLFASERGETVGTVTLGFDSPEGLLADEDFKDVIDAYRMQGGRVCEITKLAIAPTANSRKTLASLCHVMFIYSHTKHRCTDVFIEVNPRHRRYYETMLGFQCLGGQRFNKRVNAPSYLLWTSLDHVAQQIATLAGTGMRAGGERSLYPHFLSPSEADALTERLLNLKQK